MDNNFWCDVEQGGLKMIQSISPLNSAKTKEKKKRKRWNKSNKYLLLRKDQSNLSINEGNRSNLIDNGGQDGAVAKSWQSTCKRKTITRRRARRKGKNSSAVESESATGTSYEDVNRYVRETIVKTEDRFGYCSSPSRKPHPLASLNDNRCTPIASASNPRKVWATPQSIGCSVCRCNCTSLAKDPSSVGGGVRASAPVPVSNWQQSFLKWSHKQLASKQHPSKDQMCQTDACKTSCAPSRTSLRVTLSKRYKKENPSPGGVISNTDPSRIKSCQAQDIVQCIQRLSQNGLTSNVDGNVSPDVQSSALKSPRSDWSGKSDDRLFSTPKRYRSSCSKLLRRSHSKQAIKTEPAIKTGDSHLGHFPEVKEPNCRKSLANCSTESVLAACTSRTITPTNCNTVASQSTAVHFDKLKTPVSSRNFDVSSLSTTTTTRARDTDTSSIVVNGVVNILTSSPYGVKLLKNSDPSSPSVSYAKFKKKSPLIKQSVVNENQISDAPIKSTPKSFRSVLQFIPNQRRPHSNAQGDVINGDCRSSLQYIPITNKVKLKELHPTVYKDTLKIEQDFSFEKSLSKSYSSYRDNGSSLRKNAILIRRHSQSRLNASLVHKSRVCESPVPYSPVPDSPVPDSPVPDSPVCKSTFPESLVTDSPVPDSPVPDYQVPDSQVPDSQVPDSQVPDSPVPDSPVPDSPVPGSPVPDSQVPGSQVPGSPVPDSQVPGSPVPDSQVPESPVSESPVPDSLVSPVSESQVPDSPGSESSVRRFPVRESAVRKSAIRKSLVPESSVPESPVCESRVCKSLVCKFPITNMSRVMREISVMKSTSNQSKKYMSKNSLSCNSPSDSEEASVSIFKSASRKILSRPVKPKVYISLSESTFTVNHSDSLKHSPSSCYKIGDLDCEEESPSSQALVVDRDTRVRSLTFPKQTRPNVRSSTSTHFTRVTQKNNRMKSKLKQSKPYLSQEFIPISDESDFEGNTIPLANHRPGGQNNVQCRMNLSSGMNKVLKPTSKVRHNLRTRFSDKRKHSSSDSCCENNNSDLLDVTPSNTEDDTQMMSLTLRPPEQTQRATQAMKRLPKKMSLSFEKQDKAALFSSSDETDSAIVQARQTAYNYLRSSRSSQRDSGVEDKVEPATNSIDPIKYHDKSCDGQTEVRTIKSKRHNDFTGLLRKLHKKNKTARKVDHSGNDENQTPGCEQDRLMSETESVSNIGETDADVYSVECETPMQYRIPAKKRRIFSSIINSDEHVNLQDASTNHKEKSSKRVDHKNRKPSKSKTKELRSGNVGLLLKTTKESKKKKHAKVRLKKNSFSTQNASTSHKKKSVKTKLGGKSSASKKTKRKTKSESDGSKKAKAAKTTKRKNRKWKPDAVKESNRATCQSMISPFPSTWKPVLSNNQRDGHRRALQRNFLQELMHRAFLMRLSREEWFEVPVHGFSRDMRRKQNNMLIAEEKRDKRLRAEVEADGWIEYDARPQCYVVKDKKSFIREIE